MATLRSHYDHLLVIIVKKINKLSSDLHTTVTMMFQMDSYHWGWPRLNPFCLQCRTFVFVWIFKKTGF